MNKKQIKQIKEWLDDILMVEYHQDAVPKLRLEDIKEFFKNEN